MVVFSLKSLLCQVVSVASEVSPASGGLELQCDWHPGRDRRLRYSPGGQCGHRQGIHTHQRRRQLCRSVLDQFLSYCEYINVT